MRFKNNGVESFAKLLPQREQKVASNIKPRSRFDKSRVGKIGILYGILCRVHIRNNSEVLLRLINKSLSGRGFA